jgi:hypothetical protein
VAADKDLAGTGSNSEGNVSTSTSPPPPCPCQWLVNGIGRSAYRQHSSEENELISTARDLFGLEENGLLLKGEDATLRLRQLHDQIMVLRGATFNGLISCSFCLFAWGVKMRREKPRSVLRWLLALVPVMFLFLAGDAFYHHLQERELSNPPFMEFSLFVVGGAGAVLLWRSGPLWVGSARSEAKSSEAKKSEADKSAAKDEDCLRHWRWGALSFLFAVLALAGVLGWWATEVLYAKQVIYSYDSQSNSAQK